jgi:hypothetical protein
MEHIDRAVLDCYDVLEQVRTSLVRASFITRSVVR